MVQDGTCYTRSLVSRAESPRNIHQPEVADNGPPILQENILQRNREKAFQTILLCVRICCKSKVFKPVPYSSEITSG